MTLTLRSKLLSVAIATVVFVVLAAMLAALLDYPMTQTLVGAALVGATVAAIEIFYVSGHSGRWLRAMHPVRSLAIYALVLVGVVVIAMHVNHALLGRLDRLPESYARLPLTVPLVFVISLVAVTAIRIIEFVGARNVFHLVIGTYHRPVLEERVFLFLDIKGSTAMVEQLGPVRARALIGKFFFDILSPITDHGGHVVVSEEGDTKRAIGFYGDTIHIAARMEQKAKELGVDTVISEDVFNAIQPHDARLVEVAQDTVRGISQPIRMYTFSGDPGQRASTAAPPGHPVSGGSDAA